MTVDWRRKILGLPLTGALSERAVRAAYWRIVGSMRNRDDRQSSVLSDLQTAKRELLFNLGVRIPRAKGRAGPLCLPAGASEEAPHFGEAGELAGDGCSDR
jgi:hypothetical protein